MGFRQATQRAAVLFGAGMLAAPLTSLASPGMASAVPGAPAAGRPAPAVVVTADGALHGTVTADHRVFQGIPYAAPPVGPLRWRPPQPAARWTGVRDATAPASPCPQPPVAVLPGASNRTGSTDEDCLYLNVWTPARIRPGRHGLPVFVWLHGGANTVGAGSDYDASLLAERGLVVVTVNYRLGALGFLAHPALSAQSPDRTSGDYGLMDQQAALRWVRRNVAAFGGDPHQVTVGGESAGSLDTCDLIASPTARGLFVRAIEESGSCLAGGAVSPPTLAQASAAGQTFATSVGCPNSPAPAAAACLRAVPVTTLVTAEAARDWGPNTGPPVLPISPAAAWATGRAGRVPTLLGSNHDEFRFFTSVDIDFTRGTPLTAATYQAQVRQEFGGVADQVLAEYPAASFPTPNLAYATLKTDSFFSCPARADDIGYAGNRVPVFAYEFDDPNAPPFVTDPNMPQGAFHAAELAYLFPGAQLDPAQQRLSEQMVGYWYRFIATGDPNGPHAPAWPRFRAAGPIRHGRAEAIEELRPDGIGPTSGFGTDHRCGFWQTAAGIPN